MTDDSNEPENGSGNLPEHDVQAETWHEELPPEDDFHDQPELASSLTEESEAASSPFETPPPGKRSGTTVMMGVIAVVILFVGGMVYLQFGGSGKAGPAAPVPFSVSGNAAPVPATQKKPAITGQGAADMPAAPTSAEADITAIYNSGLSKTTAPVASSYAIPGGPEIDSKAAKPAETQASTSDIMTTNPATPSGAAAVPSALMGPGTVLPAAAKTETAPSVKPASAVEAKVTAQPASPAAAPTPQPQPQGAAQADMDVRLKEMASQIDEIKKALQQNTQQMNQLLMRVESDKGAAPGGASVESRLDLMEQQLSRLAGKKAAKPSTKQAVHDLGGEESVTGIAVEKEPAAPKPAAKKTAKIKEHKTKTRQKAEGARHKVETWVLRAATPDAAWVSQSPSSPQLQQVHVGETLPGIGKVREIRQTGNAWVVVGDKGTIR